MGKKQLILLLAGVAALAVFFLLPANRVWMRETVIAYWNDFTAERKKTDPEYRKRLRYGSSYTYSKQIAAFFEQKDRHPQALVLVPASGYFEQNHIHYTVPEPVVFYYFTGLKTVRPGDATAAQANWYVSVKDGRLAVDTANDPAALQRMIATLRKIDPSL